MGYSPQDGKKSDTTEQLTHTHHTRQPAEEEEQHGYHSLFLVLTEEKEASS